MHYILRAMYTQHHTMYTGTMYTGTMYTGIPPQLAPRFHDDKAGNKTDLQMPRGEYNASTNSGGWLGKGWGV